jgi:hypothetical protein
MRLHGLLRASAVNVYSTGPWKCWRAEYARPSHRMQPMEVETASRALTAGEQEPVPESVCYSAERARWRIQRMCCYDG